MISKSCWPQSKCFNLSHLLTHQMSRQNEGSRWSKKQNEIQVASSHWRERCQSRQEKDTDTSCIFKTWSMLIPIKIHTPGTWVWVPLPDSGWLLSKVVTAWSHDHLMCSCINKQKKLNRVDHSFDDNHHHYMGSKEPPSILWMSARSTMMAAVKPPFMHIGWLLDMQAMKTCEAARMDNGGPLSSQGSQ